MQVRKMAAAWRAREGTEAGAGQTGDIGGDAQTQPTRS